MECAVKNNKMHTLVTDEKIYPTYKVAKLAIALGKQGISAEDLLAGTAISQSELSSNSARISRRQVIGAYRNAVRLSKDSSIGLSAGSHLGLIDYGLYGYALISSATLQSALEFAIKYHQMATPTVRMELLIDDEEKTAAFRMQDLLDIPDLYVFNLELQFSLVFSLFKEMAGNHFRFSKILAAFPQPPHHQAYREIFECAARFGNTTNDLVFDIHWLDRPLARSNPITAATARELCDQFFMQMNKSTGIARDVYTIITKDLCSYNNIETVAGMLNVSPRTLRRKLADQGTTFRQLHNDVRMQLAIEFLKNSNMSTDEVADRLGFSDAANFRHAFKRWTKKTTSEFRRSSRTTSS